MIESDFQKLSTVHSKGMALPPTIASAARIAPDTFLTFVSGTVAVENITPPVNAMHMLCLVFTDASPGTMVTTGNILTAVVPTSALPTFMVYNPVTAKYSGGTLNLT